MEGSTLSPGSGESEHLSKREAYIAMYYFVDAYFLRGRKKDSGLAMLASDLRPLPHPDDTEALRTKDPAFWNDWRDAIARARSEGIPK
jgi:hypothetical protein